MPKRINIKGEHAIVRTLGLSEQAKMFGLTPPEKKSSLKMLQFARAAERIRKREGRIVKRTHVAKDSIVPASYSAALSLANLLFPNNFPKIIATDLKKSNSVHSNTTYSKQVILTKESQRGIDSFYEERAQGNGFIAHHNNSDFSNYYKKNHLEIQKISDKISAETGLEINDGAMNVGITKKGSKSHFVFFELDGIDFGKLNNYIQKLPAQTIQQKIKKRQAELLFNLLDSQKPKNKILSVHAQQKYVDRSHSFV